MRRTHPFFRPAGLAMCLGLMPVLSAAQNVPVKIEIPADAIRLEGIPRVRIEEEETRDNQPLRLNLSGDFTYLSTDPGHYIRLSRVGDKLTYVEHVEMDARSVTWRGELTIVLGKKP